ncbi:MAG: hypothetical protein Unbinned5350contig1001_34 [Prokaryotic dsDNA virus sp.]|nr:MAG: hypothetical protein Unbinned5350contig1001_34 [Prokaryotic dsDNA virus sp.]|tara:strand:- start:15491 stop:15757 length:267 start_codon:yes stop_codon:yes gene_type:complete
MKSEVKNIELVTEFPCLMEYRMQGEVLVGIYIVNEYPLNEVTRDKYSVCMISSKREDVSSVGETFFKQDLDPKEWFPLPPGTQVTLVN